MIAALCEQTMKLFFLMIFIAGNKIVADICRRKYEKSSQLLVVSFFGHISVSATCAVLVLIFVPEASLQNLGEAPYMSAIIAITGFSLFVAVLNLLVKGENEVHL